MTSIPRGNRCLLSRMHLLFYVAADDGPGPGTYGHIADAGGPAFSMASRHNTATGSFLRNA